MRKTSLRRTPDADRATSPGAAKSIAALLFGASLCAGALIVTAPAAVARDGRHALYSDETLWPGERLVNSSRTTAYYRLSMQHDGNLVLYKSYRCAVNSFCLRPIWASNTWGNPGARLVMQNDGNLVIYDPANRPLWHTATVTGYAQQEVLVLTARGNLRLDQTASPFRSPYNPYWYTAWQTHTRQ